MTIEEKRRDLNLRLKALNDLRLITREPGWDQKVRMRAIHALVATDESTGADVTERFLNFAIANVRDRLETLP